VAEGGKYCQQLLIKSAVPLLRRCELAAVESQRQPAAGSVLLEDAADVGSRGVSGQGPRGLDEPGVPW